MAHPSEALLPRDDAAAVDDDDAQEIEFLDDESLETSDTDEEMSGELEGEEDDEDDDDGSALDGESEDDDEDDETTEDAEKADILRQKAELEARLRQIDYERQQQANQQHWDSIRAQADDAFEYEWDEIQREKHDRVDPDAYERQEVARWKSRVNDWYARFNASINEARRMEMERAAIPAYAARVAAHFSLTEDQARELLDYAPADMPREAERRARENTRIARYKKAAQQARRKAAREAQIGKGGNATGSGRAPATKVKRGSISHLAHILANA